MPEDGAPKNPANDPRERVGARMRSAGEAVGIDFTGKTDRYPNSTKAHVLLSFAERDSGREVQNRLQEILFRHYFTDGKYPDEANLREAAAEAGLNVEKAMAAVASKSEQDAVRREAEQSSRMGISGVPYFFVNGKPMGSGAQPPEAFLQAFDRA